ncbi:MAG TPA: hypothetical protein VFU68_08065 [Terracidiphilus sp.]|nr:hypothetical protein [Terracidiphilus sp.]
MKLSLWAWLLWTLPIWLLMEVGPFLVVRLIFKRSVGELVGPYLAFALPALIFMPLVWWLRMLEEQGVSPKRLARGWLLSMAIFCFTVIGATFYSGLKFQLIDPKDALGGFVAAVLLSAPSLYFISYRWTLSVISARAATKRGDPSSNSNIDTAERTG